MKSVLLRAAALGGFLFGALSSIAASAALAPPAAPQTPAAAPAVLTNDQAELLLSRDMALVARCESGKASLFLGRYYGEALDSMIAFENGAALRYPVHGGRIEKVGEKLSARFEIPEAFRLAVAGEAGRLLYNDDPKKNSKVKCRFYDGR